MSLDVLLIERKFARKVLTATMIIMKLQQTRRKDTVTFR